jgi:hypothetical protein
VSDYETGVVRERGERVYGKDGRQVGYPDFMSGVYADRGGEGVGSTLASDE